MPDSWAIELQCPQCGAPVTMEEADRILACAFCRVRLIMIHPGYPQYYLDPYLENENKPFRNCSISPIGESGEWSFPVSSP